MILGIIMVVVVVGNGYDEKLRGGMEYVKVMAQVICLQMWESSVKRSGKFKVLSAISCTFALPGRRKELYLHGSNFQPVQSLENLRVRILSKSEVQLSHTLTRLQIRDYGVRILVQLGVHLKVNIRIQDPGVDKFVINKSESPRPRLVLDTPPHPIINTREKIAKFWNDLPQNCKILE